MIIFSFSDSFMVYAAAGDSGDVFAWRRGSELKHVYRVKREENGVAGHPVRLMLPFGPHLITVDEKSVLRVRIFTI